MNDKFCLRESNELSAIVMLNIKQTHEQLSD